MKYSLSYLIATGAIAYFVYMKWFPGQEMFGWNDITATIILIAGLGISLVLFILTWILSKFFN